MSVYVDAPIWRYGRMVMCHLLADTPEELHAMADRIGVARKHFQCERTPHYDICKSKRALAITAGAIEVDRRRTGEIIKALRANPGPWREARRAHVERYEGAQVVPAPCGSE